MSTILWKPDSFLFPCLKANIDNDDVRSDLLDILIADDIIRLAAEQPAPPAVARDDQLIDLSGALVKLEISDLSELLTILQIDNFLLFQL